MKQFLICLAVFAVFAGGFWISQGQKADAATYDVIRIHIRANSDEERDQNVKFLVKDALVGYLTPLLDGVENKEQATRLISREIPGIVRSAERVLRTQGFAYGCRARLGREEFPTRSYDGIVFEGGEYSALIVELGAGSGNNWWCVMYPPLCFLNAEKLSGGGVEYRSKLMELLEKLKH